MAIYPGAVYKPTNFGGRTKRNRQGRGILHVAVSGARSLPPWNQNTWHFYVAFDGYCEQYVDTEYRAYASGDANDDAIHIETAGGLGSSKVLNAERWTPAQVARIADIMRWEASQPGGAPLELLADSKPGRRGWGPHRLGVTHSRGLGAVPGWRVPGGESWSSAVGKECPGDAKIAQIPQVIAAARGGSAKPAPIQEEDMPLNDADKQWIEGIVLHIVRAEGISGAGEYSGNALAAAQDPIASLIDPKVKIRPRDMLANLDAYAWRTEQKVAALTASLEAVAAAVRNGTAGDGFTAEQAIAAGKAGADAALAELGDKLRTT